MTPPEVPGTGNRFFYRQELMLSTVQDISPIIAVVGRCAVLDYNEYTMRTCTVDGHQRRQINNLGFFFFFVVIFVD